MRERYIDIVKGLSILCIVLLHYVHNVFPNEINVFIGSFMITTFYVTSGWVSAMYPSKRTIKELIKKRWYQLGIPYLWWTLIILVFDFVLLSLGYYDFKYIGTEVYKTITLRGIGTLWFLPALYGGEIIWCLLKKQNKTWLILLALLFTFCYQYTYNQIFIGKTETIYRILDSPFRTIKNVSQAWIGIAFGFIAFNMLKNNLLKSSNKVLMLIGILFCVFAYITSNYLPAVLNPIWSWIAPLIGPLGWLLLAKSVQQLSFFDFFNFWGINSLNLMVTHYSIVLVLFTIFVEQGLERPFDGVITLICFFMSLPIQYILVFFVNKCAKFTLGKK